MSVASTRLRAELELTWLLSSVVFADVEPSFGCFRNDLAFPLPDDGDRTDDESRLDFGLGLMGQNEGKHLYGLSCGRKFEEIVSETQMLEPS